MRVLVFFTFDYSLSSWNNSGMLNKELALFSELSKKYNINFTFVTYGDENDFKLIEPYPNFDIIPIYKYLNYSKYKPLRILKSFFIPLYLRKKIDSFDVLYQNQLLGSWVPIIAKLITSKPLMIRTGYDMLTFAIEEQKSQFKIFLYKKLTAFSIRFANTYSVTSKTDMEYLKSTFRNSNSKLVLRPNWVEETNYVELNKRQKNKILTVGRLVDQKNFELLINEFVNSTGKLQIDIVGTGSNKEELSKLAKSKKVDVNFLGRIKNEDLKNLYSRYIYFISTSKYEGNPKTILEAMSAGCVVIASKIPNHQDIIKDNIDGKLFELTKPELSKLIDDLNKDEIMLQTISKGARNRIINNNSLEDTSKSFYKSFRNLIV